MMNVTCSGKMCLYNAMDCLSMLSVCFEVQFQIQIQLHASIEAPLLSRPAQGEVETNLTADLQEEGCKKEDKDKGAARRSYQ